MNADEYDAIAAYTAQFRGDTVEETVDVDTWVSASTAIKNFTRAFSEFTTEQRAEIQRRYAQSRENPWTVEQLRQMPDVLCPDCGVWAYRK